MITKKSYSWKYPKLTQNIMNLSLMIIRLFSRKIQFRMGMEGRMGFVLYENIVGLKKHNHFIFQ